MLVKPTRHRLGLFKFNSDKMESTLVSKKKETKGWKAGEITVRVEKLKNKAPSFQKNKLKFFKKIKH